MAAQHVGQFIVGVISTARLCTFSTGLVSPFTAWQGVAEGTVVTTVASRHGEVLDALREILKPNYAIEEVAA